MSRDVFLVMTFCLDSCFFFELILLTLILFVTCFPYPVFLWLQTVGADYDLGFQVYSVHLGVRLLPITSTKYSGLPLFTLGFRFILRLLNSSIFHYSCFYLFSIWYQTIISFLPYLEWSIFITFSILLVTSVMFFFSFLIFWSCIILESKQVASYF